MMKNFVALVLVVVMMDGVRGQCSNVVSAEQQKQILDKHNEIRKRVANGEENGFKAASNMFELVWSSALAQKGQDHASSRQKFEHEEPWNSRVAKDDNGADVYYGQNLGMEEATAYPNFENTVLRWFDDEKSYLAENDGSLVKSFDTTPEKFEKYGHASQIIWATTEAVGCGTYQIAYQDRQVCMLVCNYGPPGNYPQETIYKESDNPGSECASISTANPNLCVNPNRFS